MKIFIDSSILIEYLKGNHTEFYEALLTSHDVELCINQVVLSEFIFHFIAFQTNSSPLSAKMAGKIPACFQKLNPFEMLPGFVHLSNSLEIVESAIRIMSVYNLLPNDALILSTCTHQNISHLASFDADFSKPCEDLGIKILKDTKSLDDIILAR
jgi:predicted nucleic acid-binding protein